VAVDLKISKSKAREIMMGVHKVDSHLPSLGKGVLALLNSIK
jgi:hypothetical protein